MPESWLEGHHDVLPARGRVLDLGCGRGDDSAWLRARTLEVVSTDLYPRRVARARALLGTQSLLQADHTRPLPFRADSFEAIVASLSLHYFDWRTTRALLAECARVLAPEGVLLFRVNALDDIEYGAGGGLDGGGEELEPHYWHFEHAQLDQARKRFFDAHDVRAVLVGVFELQVLAHRTLDWDPPKRVWEGVARTVPSPSASLEGAPVRVAR